MNNSTSGNVEELKEESNLIIYIVELILLIIWNSDVPNASTLEAQAIGGADSATINRVQHLSSCSLIRTVEQYG